MKVMKHCEYYFTICSWSSLAYVLSENGIFSTKTRQSSVFTIYMYYIKPVKKNTD